MRSSSNRAATTAGRAILPAASLGYDRLVSEISSLLEQARRTAARSVNAVLTSAYWQIGRRIVEHEQHGRARAGYGEGLLVSLAKDLTDKCGRGFSKSNLFQMRAFFLGWEIFQTPSGNFEARVICPALPDASIGGKCQTPSGKSEIVQTVSARLTNGLVPVAFPLSWSHYVRLISVDKPHARAFYESEAIRGGWSVRQLDRQISTQFFERTARSRRQAMMLSRGQQSRPEDAVVHYAMGGIKAKVFASHYLTALPDPETLRQEILTTQRAIEARRQLE